MSDINIASLKALTRLNLDASQEQVVPEHLQSILTYVDQLQDVTVVDEHERRVLSVEKLRDDIVCEWDDVDGLLEAMPMREGRLLEVPEVFSE